MKGKEALPQESFNIQSSKWKIKELGFWKNLSIYGHLDGFDDVEFERLF